MSDVFLFIYAAVVGFLAAALLAGVYRALMSEPLQFASHGGGIMSRTFAFAFRLVTGPAIIVRHSFASAKAGETPSSWAAAGVMVAVVWSAVLGVGILTLASHLGA